MPIDLGFLQGVYERAGPFASVYLDSSRGSEDAVAAIPLRWRALRERLGADGADEPTLAAMDAVVGTPAPGPAGRQGQAVVANGGDVLLDERTPRPPDTDTACWAELPRVLPFLADRPPQIPYLLVRIDRSGADITSYAHSRGEEEKVSGGEYPIHKSHPGGWSQLRYQRRSENLWDKNAHDVAARIEELARQRSPRMIMVTGDVRAKEKLLGHLSEEQRGRVVELDDDEHGVLERCAAADDERIVAELGEQLGRGERAASGLGATVAALREKRAATVVIQDGAATDSPLWIGDDPTQLAASAGELAGLGVDRAREVPAGEALVRAAAAGDAGILPRAAPLGLADGVGAVLRYALRPAESGR